jgi:hypothetical protein
MRTYRVIDKDTHGMCYYVEIVASDILFCKSAELNARICLRYGGSYSGWFKKVSDLIPHTVFESNQFCTNIDIHIIDKGKWIGQLAICGLISARNIINAVIKYSARVNSLKRNHHYYTMINWEFVINGVFYFTKITQLKKIIDNLNQYVSTENNIISLPFSDIIGDFINVEPLTLPNVNPYTILSITEDKSASKVIEVFTNLR